MSARKTPGRISARQLRSPELSVAKISSICVFATADPLIRSNTAKASAWLRAFSVGWPWAPSRCFLPMYVSEVSPPSIRGRLGAMYQMSIVSGILTSYAINFLLRNTGPDNWRWMFLTGALPSLIFFVFVLLAPESPRYLALAGRHAEAFAVLERISGSAVAKTQIDEILATLNSGERNWRALKRPGVLRALIVSAFLAVLIQVSGINTIIDYAPAIFQSTGWKIDAALVSTFLVGITELLFTVVSLWMIDRYGRKPLYIVGLFGMAIALGCW